MTRERERCGSCGTHPSEWMTPGGERPRIPPPYEVDTAKCEGCAEVERAQKHLIPKTTDGGTRGHRVIFRRTDPTMYDPQFWTD
jgi:hypothetical protein